MNAPDVAFKDGWYYFYFPYEKTHIGVAKSKSPIGPWSEAVTNKICTIFDPCVFVDDDGQAYIYGNDHKVDIGDKGWHVMGARLKPNMIELDGPWQRLSEEEVNEAVTVFKRNGKYYFMARKDKKTVYFMSDSPLPTKPYATFKGAVTEDVKGAPAHTSAIEFNGQWVLFYHLGTEVNNGTPCRRSVCFDKMEFNDDGTIRPVLFTLEASGREQNEVSSRAEEVMIVAHRGASRDAPQNTLPAFKLAWEQGADAIEGDFRLTKDGHIVCIHDGNTEKVATTNLVVHESTLAELRTLDVGTRHDEAFKGTGIPTISEVLATVPEGKRIYIEVKCGAEIIPSLLEEIKVSGLKPEQIAVISFNHEVIQEFKAKAPQYKAFLLYSFNERKNGQIMPPLARVMHTLKQVRADGLFSSTNVPLPVIEAVRQQGYEWHAWTINDLTEARRMTGMGAQSIITDVPGYMKKHLGEPSPAGQAAPAE
jgi:glycerophosphoryl diester phosphodiesterase